MPRALGRYELLRPLARGGMAEVYLARRRAAGIEKWLVVKRMRPERTGDPRFLDLFVREARLSMSLAHQNIVPVFDFGRIDDQVFLAMERVEGRDLGSSLARAADHCVPPLVAAFIAAECCQALDYAHQRKGPDGVALGIVHRDVTPRNVLLSWSGEVKLTDFGIAALAGDATSRLLGTPQYMAPEQARSEAIDPRADIYAIGLVLREAISGVRPRPGADRDSILDAARRGLLLPWSHLPPEAPSDAELALGSGDHGKAPDAPPAALVAIVDRAAALAPDDRYPDARSMLADLDAFMVAERAAHKAESPARQLADWLAAVWEGARDDAESDAAIDADHLVSFLDDGAIDVLGTGTVRSMAATAADDSQAVKVAAAPGPTGTAGTTGAAGLLATKPAVIAATADRPDGTARSSRISSSNSTVASGSFHTIPAPDEASTGLRARSRRRPGAAFAVISAVIVVGGAALWLNRRPGGEAASDRSSTGIAAVGAERTPGGTAPPSRDTAAGTVGPNGAAGGPATPGTSGPNSGSPASEAIGPNGAAGGPATPGTSGPNSGHPTSGGTRPGATTAGTGHPSGGTSAVVAGHNPSGPNTGHAPPGGAGGSGASGPNSGHPATGPGSTRGPAASGSGAHPGGEPATGSSSASPGGGTTSPGPARSATCRVRINLTPWAYYIADQDGIQRETPGTIDLTPGPHRLHVWNPELHVERDIVINVPADRDTMNYSEPLQPSSLAPDAGVR